MARNLQNWCRRTHWNGWFSFIFSVDEHVLSIANKIIIFYWQDIRSFFSPKGKTSKPGASKVEDKRGKDSRAKPASKDPGKGRAKSKVIIFFFVFVSGYGWMDCKLWVWSVNWKVVDSESVITFWIWNVKKASRSSRLEICISVLLYACIPPQPPPPPYREVTCRGNFCTQADAQVKEFGKKERKQTDRQTNRNN